MPPCADKKTSAKVEAKDESDVENDCVCKVADCCRKNLVPTEIGTKRGQIIRHATILNESYAGDCSSIVSIWKIVCNRPGPYS